MCYHISIPAKRVIIETFDCVDEQDEEDINYEHLSGFSFAKVPIIKSEQSHKLQSANWGLIPFWSKNLDQAKEKRSGKLNARSETVFELPSYNSIITKKRCLVIVDGFFEWHTIGKNKYPHFIHLKDRKAFAMGGIYDNWVDKETGEIITTCSIITVPANPLMAKIHNKLDEHGNPDPRMPLILDLRDEKIWIDPDLPKTEIESLMKPFDENQMEAHTISKLITSRKEDSNVPAVKDVFNYPELQPKGESLF